MDWLILAFAIFFVICLAIAGAIYAQDGEYPMAFFVWAGMAVTIITIVLVWGQPK